MAKTTELVYSVGRKITDGNYGSVDFFALEKVSLDEHDNQEVVYEALRARVTQRVLRDLQMRGIPSL